MNRRVSGTRRVLPFVKTGFSKLDIPLLRAVAGQTGGAFVTWVWASKSDACKSGCDGCGSPNHRVRIRHDDFWFSLCDDCLDLVIAVLGQLKPLW